MASTSRGDHFLDLLLRFFSHWRDLYRANPRHPGVTNADMAEALRLTPEDTLLLGNLLSAELMAGVVRMTGNPQPDGSWSYTIPSEIDVIGEPGDLKSVIEGFIARNNRPGESVFLDERVTEAHRKQAIGPEYFEVLDEIPMETVSAGERRYQVFVSSTYEDLKRERQAVMIALLETKCIPAGMELFPAANLKQWELIKRVIDESDYYLVVVGGRYGSMSGKVNKRISYTEREYDYAVLRKKPLLGFFHSAPDKLDHARREQTLIGRKRLEKFRLKVQTRLCHPWRSPAELGSAVKSAVIRAITEDPQPGWVRAPARCDPHP